MSVENREKYLTETILPSAVETGRFGKGVSFVKCVQSSNSKSEDQFASAVLFLKCIVRSPGGSDSDYGLVVKFQPADLGTRAIHNSDVQFHNENIMYSQVLPFINYKNIIEELFPKFYYAVTSLGKDPDNDVVIIQDLGDQKFQLSKEKLFLDFEHIVIALKELGKFHALSYIAKQRNPDEFYKVKEELIEHAWNRQDDTIIKVMLGPCGLRGVYPNIEENPTTFLKTFQKLLADPIQLMKDLVKPTEHAVICHGDFCRNNILYNYEDDKPIKVRFFDLQTSRYSSPVIDLSLLLFLNTEPELRAKHWDDFIKAYHETLHETVTSAGCVAPSLQDINREFQKKGVYGYMHCSYFLPICVGGGPPPLEKLAHMTPEEMVEMFVKVGGDAGTKYLAEIVRHLNKLNCTFED